VSYILDALTKAARQRDQQVPVVQRLLSPRPRPQAPWSNASGRLLIALGVNAVLLAAALSWWLRPAPVTGPSEPTSAVPEAVATPRPASASPRPLVKLEPVPHAETTVEKSIAPTPGGEVTAPAGPNAAPAIAAPTVTPPATAPPIAVAPPLTPPAAPRPGVAAPTIQATPTPPPGSVPRGPAPPEAVGLKLEALIYGDTRAERLVFINGRRYREGDSIDDRLRVEEIREEGVDLSDQGRPFTLRVAR